MMINVRQKDTAKSSLFAEGKIPFHAEPGHLCGVGAGEIPKGRAGRPRTARATVEVLFMGDQPMAR